MLRRPISAVRLLLYFSLTFYFITLESCKPKVPATPNFLFCIADDWGWPHAGAYGDQVVKTPTFDRLAEEGILFEHSYVSSPSCTPSRNAILTGQYHWRLGEGANLWSTLDVNIPVYPLLLEEAGYFIGHWRKCWGPGDLQAGGYTEQYPGGPAFDGFEDFMNQLPEGQPFCFWFGSPDPHRGYKLNSGKESGIDIDAITLPAFYPDEEIIKSDLADYYWEVQRFDADCGKAIALLEELGYLENTVIFMTGDNGIPFPRCKSNLYDMGTREPLAIRWGDVIKPKRVVQDFVSFTDFAPTILELAGVEIPEVMTGKSLLPIFTSDKNGWISKDRTQIIFGKERHVPAQEAPSMAGYPCRSIRTAKWQYIYNFEPDRWPAGVPEGASHPSGKFADTDGGPTKHFLMTLKDDPELKKYYDWSYAKRPREELYDMENDPDQLVNLAGQSEYMEVQKELNEKLFSLLRESQDPRITGGGEKFDQYPYRTNYKLNK
jgi:N-sulfoglucosamine sulfohydrolase